jgi:hypothetical protein
MGFTSTVQPLPVRTEEQDLLFSLAQLLHSMLALDGVSGK